MSDGNDKRASDGRVAQRFPVDWRVTLKLPDWAHASRVAAQNASRGGLFVLTSRPPDVGTVVELSIELPDGGKLDVTGTVQHVVTPERALVSGLSPGIGVRIDDKHAVDILLLEQMAAAAGVRSAPPAAWEGETGATPASARPVGLGRIQLVPGQASRVVGVDFGTSLTRIACLVGERAVLAADAEGRTAQPSAVSFPPGAAPLAGWAARARMGVDPHRTVLEAKRLLGRPLDAPDVHGLVAAAPFRVVASPEGAGPAVDLGDRTVAIVDVVATLLAHVREVGERHFRRSLREAVFTVGADAGEDGRAALRAAATQAGFEVAGLLDEPAAVALAAGPGPDPELVAVADWGGGGFALNLLDIAAGRTRLLVREHDPHLGAGELVAVIADLAADAFWRETKLELRQAVIPWQRLLLEAESALRVLASEDRAVLAVERIALAPHPVSLRQEVTAIELEAGAGELLARALEVCGAALTACGVERSRVGRVIVAGGAARLPFVRAALANYFERDIAAPAPDELVVAGAARRGASVIRFAS